MPTLTPKQVTDVCAAIFEAAGAPEDRAQIVAEHLTRANLCGHDSHGIQNVPALISLIKEGMIKPQGEWNVVRETPSTALIDGGLGLGQVVCQGAIKVAMNKARTVGSGSVGVYNCTHIGRLGDYTTTIAEGGMIGVIYANSMPGVAPYGGRTRVLGTNPLSYAFPTGDGDPILVDFATSVVAAGKVRAAQHRGEKIPEGWVLDKDGKPTTDPSDLFLRASEPNSAGVLLPAAGHKGYSLAVVVDLLGGALTGSGSSKKVAKARNGVFVQAFNIESFVPMEVYLQNLKGLVAEVKNASVADGFDEILVPGEPELRSKQKRLADGIPIPDFAWQEVIKTAKDFGLDLDTILSLPK